MEEKPEANILWIAGKPGTGKSTLASVLYLNTQQKRVQHLSWFFHARPSKRDSALDLLRVLVLQLKAYHGGTIPEPLESLMLSEETNEDAPISVATFEHSLQDIFALAAEVSPFRIILDGMDHLGRDIVAAIVRSICSYNPFPTSKRTLSFICTSREIPPPRPHLSLIDLEGNAEAYRALYVFISQRLLENQPSMKGNLQELTNVTEMIRLHAKNSFAWADMISGQSSQLDIQGLKRLAQESPRDVQDGYRYLISQIGPKQQLVAQSVFSWLLATYRTLKLDEVLEGLTLGSGRSLGECGFRLDDVAHRSSSDFATEESTKKYVVGELIAKCGGLIVVSPNFHVYFRHPIIGQILYEAAARQNAASPLSRAHEIIANVCIHVLQEHTVDGLVEHERVIRFSPLRKYAEKYWSRHIEAALAPGQGTNEAFRRNLLQYIAHKTRGDRIPPSNAFPSVSAEQLLEFGASNGIPRLVSMSLRMGLDLSTISCIDGSSPLNMAIRSGSIDTVKILLTAKASPNGVCENGKASPLFYALLPPRKDMVSLLLRNGADLNGAIDIDGRTALHVASASGQGSIIKFLLDKGADLKSKTLDYAESAIHIAAAAGHEQALLVLLRHYRFLDGLRRFYRDKVSQHLTKSQWESDRMVVDKSEEAVNVWDWDARMDSKSDDHTLGMLSESCGIVEATNVFGQTALHLAAFNGHEQIIKMLLDAGARRDLRDAVGLTAADVARQQDHATIVSILAYHKSNKDAGPREEDVLRCLYTSGPGETPRVMCDSGFSERTHRSRFIKAQFAELWSDIKSDSTYQNA